MQTVQFPNRTITMAGHLHLPADFDETKRHAALIAIHPGGGVKEQTAGLYAAKLAERGFVVLTFDASHQGESGGLPRLLDLPTNRVNDVFAAADFLTTLPFVDAARIGVLGICAGGGFAVKSATLDRRIRAVGTVSAVNIGTATRRGWDGKGNEADLIATLDAVAAQRTAEAAGAEPVFVPYVPQCGDTTAPADLQQAADYYLTPRAQHSRSPNQMLLSGLADWVSFDAFDRVETFLTRPLLSIAGSEAGSLWHSVELNAKAAGPKELVIVEGATHMDFYDRPVFVDPAVEKLAAFYAATLVAA